MFRLILGISFIFCSQQIFCTTNEKEFDIAENELIDNLTARFYDEHLLQDIERHLEVINLKQELLVKKVDDLQKLLEKDAATVGNEKSKALSSCDEALSDDTKRDGIYQIRLPDQYKIDPFYVYCMRDQKTNETWTIIQRRKDGKINFYRSWHEYNKGFGDLFADYWLRLEKIHALTHSKPHKLWIELKDFEDDTHTANFEMFYIDNENSKYALSALGNYSGNAGDSLRYHAGHKFSTKDHINGEGDNNNCAIERKAGWWFNYCQECNLNGEYLEGSLDKDFYGRGINWYTWHGRYYSLKYVHMAVRPVD